MLTSFDDIEKGVFGTTHPANPEEYTGKFDLIIVPGLAFDDKKYRLGYGGGYYDNFLVNHPEAYKIGIFYPAQKVENVPTEAHDICLDEILINNNLH
jgi:5-formyltetrahydrofolate cyclo-ligase